VGVSSKGFSVDFGVKSSRITMDGWDLMAQAEQVKAAVRGAASVSGQKKQLFDSGYTNKPNLVQAQARAEQERQTREQLETAQVC